MQVMQVGDKQEGYLLLILRARGVIAKEGTCELVAAEDLHAVGSKNQLVLVHRILTSLSVYDWKRLLRAVSATGDLTVNGNQSWDLSAE